MSVKVAVIVTMAISVLSACTSVESYHDAEHDGLTLRQKIDRLKNFHPIRPGWPTLGTTKCVAAVERFRPDGNNREDYKKAEQEIVQIFEEFLDVAKINGKVLSDGIHSRHFGVTCRLYKLQISKETSLLLDDLGAAKARCKEAGGRNCIIVMSSYGTEYDFHLARIRSLISSDENKVTLERKQKEKVRLEKEKVRLEKEKVRLEKENFLASLSSQCEVFGYTKGTEKFADCMKDLYLKETNSKQQSVQNNSASDAQLQVLRQQLELQRQQAAAAAEAEKRRQGFELLNQGLNTLNPSPPPRPSNRPLTCRTMSNGITTCQ